MVFIDWACSRDILNAGHQILVITTHWVLESGLKMLDSSHSMNRRCCVHTNDIGQEAEDPWHLIDMRTE